MFHYIPLHLASAQLPSASEGPLSASASSLSASSTGRAVSVFNLLSSSHWLLNKNSNLTMRTDLELKLEMVFRTEISLVPDQIFIQVDLYLTSLEKYTRIIPLWEGVFFVLYLSISTVLYTAWAFQKRSWKQQLTLCRSLHAEALQATVSEGLPQGPCVAARAGFAPTTHRSNGIDSTNAPPRPTIIYVHIHSLSSPIILTFSFYVNRI